jgi:hypothetical protein
MVPDLKVQSTEIPVKKTVFSGQSQMLCETHVQINHFRLHLLKQEKI